MRFTLLFLLFAGSLAAQLPYVNPFIGTDAHGHTYPGAVAPFGLVQLSPDTRPTTQDWDGCSGYHYSDSLIYGFSHTHLSGTGVPDYCDVLVMPYTGSPALEPAQYASSFKKRKERAEAGYYSVVLEKDNIKAELTATERVGVHRYTFPKNREKAHLLFDLRHRDEVLASYLKVVNPREIEGYRISKGWATEQHVYFVARFSQPISTYKNLDMSQNPREANPSNESKSIIALFDFTPGGEPVVVTVGISGVSIEGARKNLEAECNHFDFDRVRSETQAKWTSQLSKISVEGGSDAQKTAFYSALYHTMIVPNVWNDVDGQYRGRDNQLHSIEAGHNMYTVFSLWDTYRACNPLYTLLEPARTQDFIRTFLRQYDEGGLLPVWELSGNETDCMIGNHAIPVIADAYIKGLRDFDADKALTAMQHSATQDRYGLRWYKQLGYIPADKEHESVSKTLEYAFDDWCIAQMARAMNHSEVYQTYTRRAQNYKNIFDPNTGFFRGKNNASWHVPFDPTEVNFNYTEANAWQYRFAAPQDVKGMIGLLGGPAAFATQLDSLFSAHPKTSGRNQADITGLIGQYAHGNEPSHHMAYLYNYAGQPAKTQQRVRQIMDEMYSDKPDGLSGNEDCGQMSAWLVFSAMGFYPAVPASGAYAIGTPWFEKITLRLDNGKTFTVQAPGVSADKRYVQNLQLNGRNRSQSWISHSDILEGGELRFDMGATPGAWAQAEADRPVTAISDYAITPAPFVQKGERAFYGKQNVVLGCLDPEASIYYTLDGSEPTTASSRFKAPISMKKTTRLRMMAVKGTEQSAVVEAQFSQIPSGRRIERYNTQYNSQYTARGDKGLIDMLRGGVDFRSGEWQGYEGVNLDVVIDLGKKKTIRKVSAGFLQDENAWIFYPSKIQVEISDDGRNFRPLGETANTVSTTEKGALTQDLSVEAAAPVRTRYVRVIGVSLGQCPATHKGAGYPCWVMTDEVVIE